MSAVWFIGNATEEMLLLWEQLPLCMCLVDIYMSFGKYDFINHVYVLSCTIN